MIKAWLLEHGIDADQVWPGIWQGAMPRHGDYVRRAGFDVLVLCAVEWQPAGKRFPGVEVIHLPLDDTAAGLSQKEWKAARKVASYVAHAAQAGGAVLVTCAQGRNRSGVVSAMAICELTGSSGHWAVATVRRARQMALTNDTFVSQLGRINTAKGQLVQA